MVDLDCSAAAALSGILTQSAQALTAILGNTSYSELNAMTHSSIF
jgi:hypothetical protein